MTQPTPETDAVRIVEFPATRVAAVEHHGPPQTEALSAQRLIAWRRRLGVSPQAHRTYGVHHTDPRRTPAAAHRVDFCVSYDGPIEPNSEGVVEKVLPACRCAVARHHGSTEHIAAAPFLWEVWLPASGEQASGLPMIFHYLTVGPGIAAADRITDVYLPLR